MSNTLGGTAFNADKQNIRKPVRFRKDKWKTKNM
jgi:hypothetical protein